MELRLPSIIYWSLASLLVITCACLLMALAAADYRYYSKGESEIQRIQRENQYLKLIRE